jgi:hypothetical protein
MDDEQLRLSSLENLKNWQAEEERYQELKGMDERGQALTEEQRAELEWLDASADARNYNIK